MAQAALQAERDRAQLERDRAQAAVDALDAARRDTLELVARLTRLETLVLSGKVRALEAERAALADRAGVKLKRPKPKR
jgi:malonyl CoA-acyl carrier protein transacylase